MFKKIIIPMMVGIAMVTTAFYGEKVDGKESAGNSFENKGSYSPVVVLELFTSQGCSSCPPADVLLDKAKMKFPNEVFALSYHVDYWNYIGWEDPFSKSLYTKKQRAYNRKFRYNSNYTPQLVVNGMEHFVGSNSTKLWGKINSYAQKRAENKVLIENIEPLGRAINFEYDVKGPIENKQLRAVLVINERTTGIKRGENRNRTLKNSNIVVNEVYLPIEAVKGNGSITIPSLVNTKDKLTLILLVEDYDTDITGAAKSKI